uniref:Secreted protein n=1 Tax=Oryza brachyantha TaxID=4533 RepID=J3LYX3_ORYBR
MAWKAFFFFCIGYGLRSSPVSLGLWIVDTGLAWNFDVHLAANQPYVISESIFVHAFQSRIMCE